MIKKALHSVIAVFVLISSTGFTINTHYCHDQLIDMALFAPAKSCCDSNAKGLCHAMDGISKKDHCQDKSVVVEPVDDYEASPSTFNSENAHKATLFLTSLALNYFPGINESTKIEVPWYKKPPPYQAVVLSKIQSYLI